MLPMNDLRKEGGGGGIWVVRDATKSRHLSKPCSKKSAYHDFQEKGCRGHSGQETGIGKPVQFVRQEKKGGGTQRFKKTSGVNIRNSY